MATKNTIDDTVSAKIIPINLYELIYPVKEAQFVEYGRVESYNNRYEQKMLALLEGKPRQRLQEDRIAREVVRAILSADSRVRLAGINGGIRSDDATFFPNVSNTDVRQRLYGLMNEDGLLDVMFGGCGDSGLWCFESEIISWEEKVIPSGKQKPYSNYWTKYKTNKPLRDALTSVLKQFETEKPMYVHPQP